LTYARTGLGAERLPENGERVSEERWDWIEVTNRLRGRPLPTPGVWRFTDE